MNIKEGVNFAKENKFVVLGLGGTVAAVGMFVYGEYFSDLDPSGREARNREEIGETDIDMEPADTGFTILVEGEEVSL